MILVGIGDGVRRSGLEWVFEGRCLRLEWVNREGLSGEVETVWAWWVFEFFLRALLVCEFGHETQLFILN